jgi:hypothetical protein
MGCQSNQYPYYLVPESWRKTKSHICHGVQEPGKLGDKKAMNYSLTRLFLYFLIYNPRYTLAGFDLTTQVEVGDGTTRPRCQGKIISPPIFLKAKDHYYWNM